ncbi:MAG TPA: hypothetical protein VF762_13865, partial [Blastocatellia bacterium]
MVVSPFASSLTEASTYRHAPAEPSITLFFSLLNSSRRRVEYSFIMSSSIKPFKVGSIEVGGRNLFLVAGPCLVENESHALKMALSIRAITDKLGIPYIFKSSYDKANRTSVRSHRGLGVEEGLRILGRVRSETGLAILTDVH